MEQLIDGEIDEIKVIDKQILRENRSKNLITKEVPIRLDFNFDKRVVTDGLDTYPFGYYKWENLNSLL